MRYHCVVYMALLSILFLSRLLGQHESKVVISGVVSDSATRAPLDNVNVFLASTTIGTSTGLDGQFIMPNIPLGAFGVVVSKIGYGRVLLNLRVTRPETLRFNIDLQHHIPQEEVGEKKANFVTENPEEWHENLQRFVKGFIGTSPNAEQCHILNPEVIKFHYSKLTDTLIATTDSMIRMENRALGYRVSVLLRSFVWNVQNDFGLFVFYPRFETLQPYDTAELNRWHENRIRSFSGSLRHFLRALYTGTTVEEKFTILSGQKKFRDQDYGHEISGNELVVDDGSPFRLLRFPGFLKVLYSGHDTTKDRISVGFITMTQPTARIDERGTLLNPLSLKVSGVWAINRIADLLPIDEEP